MADVKIRVLGEDKTKSALGKIDKNLLKMAGSLVTISGAAMVARKAFDWAKEGTALDLTEKRFDRLAISIGTTADALSKDLGEATAGMLSDMDQMDLATQLMSLGLAKSHDEAIRMSSAAAQLNMDMNQLVLTLTNQTTMRFDALGVAVDGFGNKVKKLEDAGHDANEAFKLAFLEQAEEQIERVGSAADTAAGDFLRAEAQIKNAEDGLKRFTMQALLPAIKGFNNLTGGMENIHDAYDEMQDKVITGKITLEQYNQTLEEGRSVWGRIADANADFLNNLLGITTATLEYNPELQKHIGLLESAAVAEGRLAEVTNDVKEAKTYLDVATRIYTEGLDLDTIAAWENVAALEAQKAALDAMAGGLKTMAPMLKGGYSEWDAIGDPYAAGGSSGGSGKWQLDALGREYRRNPDGTYDTNYATGGEFTVMGSGGTDTTPVGFMATPGETVKIGGGTSDMETIVAEVRTLVRSLPTTIADAMERN